MSLAGRLPNFFIAGVPKAGTSSVFAWLAAHPDAQGAAEKETCFFADPESHIHRPDFNHSQGLEVYARQFPAAAAKDPKAIFEATPAYIYQRAALARIPDLPTRPKCLFLLREPAAQIASVHRYYRDNWAMIPADMGLADFLAAVRRGAGNFAGNELARDAIDNARYAGHLARWRERLGADRMKILLFEEVMGNPRAAMQDLAEWLGLDPGFYSGYAFPKENQSYAPRSRLLQRVNVALRGRLPGGRLYDWARGLYRRANTRAPAAPGARDQAALNALRAEFAGDNRALADRFGLDLSAWDG